MADYVNDNYDTLADIDGDGDGVSDEDINEVILSYYDAFIASGGDVNELPDDLPGINPDDIPDDIGGLIP